jgi:hypothetical protein
MLKEARGKFYDVPEVICSSLSLAAVIHGFSRIRLRNQVCLGIVPELAFQSKPLSTLW